METLDQRLGGDQKLGVIRQAFASDQSFVQGVAGLLRDGDVLLLTEGEAVPEWKVRALFRDGEIVNNLEYYTLHLTDQGAHKVT